MEDAYLNAIADAGGALITHIGLVDDNGDELTGDGYARQAVTWTSAGSGGDDAGTIRPNANLTFSVPAGTVAGWQGYSASSSGTAYGIVDLNAPEVFAAPGTAILVAANTALHHAVEGS
jgi:hypothetical protein